MVRLRLSASRFVRARVGAPRAAAVSDSGVCGTGQRHARERPRLRPALRAAAAAVALSVRRGRGGCALVRRVRAVRAPRKCAAHLSPKSICSTTPSGGWSRMPAVRLALRLAVLGLFVVTILAGLVGDPNPYRNIAPTLVWIIWWVGLAYVQAFLGDVWSLINPWRTAFDAAELAVPTRWGTKRARLAAVLSARARSLAGLPPPSWPSAGSNSSIPTQPFRRTSPAWRSPIRF